MALVNEHFLKLPGSYLFSDIAKKIKSFADISKNVKPFTSTATATVTNGKKRLHAVVWIVKRVFPLSSTTT